MQVVGTIRPASRILSSFSCSMGRGSKKRSEYRFLANSEKDDAESRSFKIRFALRNIDFDRNKRYYLILRNLAKPDEYIEKEQFTIDILQFKVF